MIEVLSPIRHNGRLYGIGERITDITPEQAAVLVDAASADWQRIKPKAALPLEDRGSDQDSSTDVYWEAEVKKYHKHFGNYEIPGAGMVKGKDAAIEALKQARTKG